MLVNAPENVMLLLLQDLEPQLEDVMQQMQNSTESMHIKCALPISSIGSHGCCWNCTCEYRAAGS